ncbi:hypothetical protein ABKN59_008811 [Abortiporus biennis]
MSNSPLASSVSEPTQHGPGRTLLFYEEFWRDQQQWLEESGYMLRPRHKPDWKPSWSPGDHLWAHEDAIVQNLSSIMDATRIKDGREFVRQIIEGYMHTLNVAHRDIMDLNTMMDAKGMKHDRRELHVLQGFEVLTAPG